MTSHLRFVFLTAHGKIVSGQQDYGLAEPIVNPSSFLKHLKEQSFYLNQLVHVERIGARGVRYESLARPLLRPLVEAIKASGTDRLYSHQAQAIDAIRAGRDVVVATGTASGKTLCYNLPVLEAALLNSETRALYLFPTKALAQDQLRALTELSRQLKAVSPAKNGLPPWLPRFGSYDGDTPQSSRTRLRRDANIILTNPDMLHVGILPNHSLWAHFLKNLKFVVVDEAHIYRGVFGSHVAAVLRRLTRLCQLYDNQP
ncbi:MAG TPA: DEAD/DEAH box helicase, partial [Anaerolineae bacterium]|nr:DEAD/DEAH box helicase [Anaerolineae bacterium]